MIKRVSPLPLKALSLFKNQNPVLLVNNKIPDHNEAVKEATDLPLILTR